MSDPVVDALRGASREEIASVVDELSPEEVVALAETLPPAEGDSRVGVTGGPADLAAALDPAFRRRPHIEAISTEIERTVADAEAGGSGKLLLLCPPRVGKTQLGSIWTPAWFLERHPDRHVIAASHESTYAVSLGRRVRDLLRSHSDHGRLAVRLSRTVAAAGEWETTLGGGMLSRGIGGSITGRGAHLFVLDDPLKDWASAHSRKVRDDQWDWYLSTASARLEPRSAVIVIMTRWHEDDIAGRFLSREYEGDPNEWRVVRIPALGEPADDDQPGDGARLPPDALAREEGEPLRLPQADETDEEARNRWAQRRREAGPYIWAGLYMQRPSEPEGTILRRAWWQFYRWAGASRIILADGREIGLDALRIVQSWDTAVSDTEGGSYVVGQVWGLYRAERLLLDEERDRIDYPATKKAMKALRERWPQTSETVVEDKANGPAVIADLKGDIPGLIAWTPRGSKEQRAHAIAGDLEAGNLHLPTPDDAPFDVRGFVHELGEFPNGTHDDRVDATTQLVLRTRGRTGSVSQPTGSKTGDGTAASLPTTRRRITRR